MNKFFLYLVLILFLSNCGFKDKKVEENPNAITLFEKSKPYIVHRIDKDTSGLLIIAKNRETAQQLTSLFRIRKIHKTYIALTYGQIDKYKDIIDNNLIRYEKRAGSPLINSHLLVRHKRYTIPLSCFILTIIAISVSSFKRRGGTGSNLAIGVSLGFLFIFLDKIFGVLVLKSNFSPAIASWGTLLIFLTIALILLRRAIR